MLFDGKNLRLWLTKGRHEFVSSIYTAAQATRVIVHVVGKAGILNLEYRYIVVRHI